MHADEPDYTEPFMAGQLGASHADELISEVLAAQCALEQAQTDWRERERQLLRDRGAAIRTALEAGDRRTTQVVQWGLGGPAAHPGPSCPRPSPGSDLTERTTLL